jgi:hypothetical protein
LEKIDVLLIKRFWDWFNSVSQDLLIDPTRKDLINSLDNYIAQLGRFDWEIGPWENDLSYLAISPNLDLSKLEITHWIIQYAPHCEGWIFFSSKPPRDWQGIWKMKNETGAEILIDSSEWEYILYEFEDKTFDMDLFVTGINGDDSTINLAIDIALTGYLGEEMFLNRIGNISIEESFSDKQQPTSLKYIKKHIESLNN